MSCHHAETGVLQLDLWQHKHEIFSSMKILNAADATAWCFERGVHVAGNSDLVSLSLENASASTFSMKLDCYPASLVDHSHALLLQDNAHPDPANFDGALVWIRETKH